MVSGRPAGYSSEEYDSDDDLSFAYDMPRRTTETNNHTKQEEPIEQKLANAISDNKIEEVKRFLEAGADVSCRGRSGWTPLMLACHVGSKEIIELLLKYNANPNEHHEMFTPLMCLCESLSKEEDQLLQCLDILLSHGANLKATDWYKTTMIMFAVKRDHQKLVLKLHELGCDIDQVDCDGWSSIFYAVDSGNIHMVQLLKDLGANINLEDRRGRSLYEIATSKYFKEIADIVNVKDKNLEIEDKIETYKPIKSLSHYQYLLQDMPDTHNKGRLHGFHSETIRIINGIGLSHLSNIFVDKNIQLAELLTWNDEDWKQVGVEMSFDRKKIKASVWKFHEHVWSKQSVKIIDRNEPLDLFSFAQILSNLLRQVHIMSASTYFYWKHRENKRTSKDLNIIRDRGLDHLDHIKQNLKSILDFVTKIDREQRIIPADLIEPKRRQRISNKKFIFFSVFIGFCAFKWNPICNFTKNVFSDIYTLKIQFIK